jgi:predicted aspartyl protease
MVLNRTMCACLFALLLANSNAAGREHGLNRDKEIRFDLYHEYLVVMQGSLGKMKKRNILFDTGSNPITIDEQLARKLDLKEEQSAPGKMQVTNGTVPTRLVTLSSLQIGPIQRNSIPAAVADLSMFEAIAGVHIDAVIGLEVFGEQSFRVDYADRRIILGPVERDPSAVPFETGPPFVTVQMEVRSQPLKVLVDTGTAGLVLFSNRVGDWQRQLPVIGERESSNMGGSVSLRQVKLDEMQMGQKSVGVGATFLVESHCCNFDGLLGISGMRVKEIGFDFERGMFSWRLKDDEELFPSRESGSSPCQPRLDLPVSAALPGGDRVRQVTNDKEPCESLVRKPPSQVR